MHRRKIEIRMRHIVGKGRSGYPNRVDAMGPVRGQTLGETLASNPLDRLSLIP
jgi:hypothetical protein